MNGQHTMDAKAALFMCWYATITVYHNTSDVANKSYLNVGVVDEVATNVMDRASLPSQQNEIDRWHLVCSYQSCHMGLSNGAERCSCACSMYVHRGANRRHSADTNCTLSTQHTYTPLARRVYMLSVPLNSSALAAMVFASWRTAGACL